MITLGLKQEMRNKCIYRDVCKYTDCNPSICFRFLEMQALLQYSELPINLQKIHRLYPDEQDRKAFRQLADIKHHVVQFAEEGECLYIYSDNCGNGKTVWSAKILLEFFNKIWENNLFKPRGLFVDVAYYLMFSKQFEDKEIMRKLSKLRNDIPYLDLVVFDDITSVKMSSYDNNILFPLINKRMLEGKAMIFTGNVEPNELKSFVGNKLQSRICSGITIEIKGEDRRMQ